MPAEMKKLFSLLICEGIVNVPMCIRWWNTLLFHLIDISLVNGYVLFQEYRKQQKSNENFNRPSKYSLLEFRENIVSQLSGLDECGNHHAFRFARQPQSMEFITEYLPVFSEKKRICVLWKRKKEDKDLLLLQCTSMSGVFTLHKRNWFF